MTGQATEGRVEYPEHEKLMAVKDESQAIGEFLDLGLPRIGGGMVIYEQCTFDCDCLACQQLYKADRNHEPDELATAGFDPDTRVSERPVQLADWRPTLRTVQSMLAEYFGIDRGKLEAEKRAMLDALRSAS